MYPQSRMRRLRGQQGLRRMVSETALAADDLIYPLFVDENVKKPRAITSMPGVMAHPLSLIAGEARSAHDLGIPAVLLFGIPKVKDERGSAAFDEQGVVQRAVREIKAEVPGLIVITDLCLCEYTSHGHCGVLRSGNVDNDATNDLYALTAISQAEAGADMVAPSGMMDGQVKAIREGLDEAGLDMVPIMAYSAKYASAYYGPFRDAAESAPKFGDRRTHQMDPGNAREAMREMELDLSEGADILMVKPALAYLDIIAMARNRFDVPIAAYNVSGEYSMVKAASAKGWIDEKRVVMETLTSIRRAGADMIITYHAKDAARWLLEGEG
ncbi:MAG: porphobilinogen synthase [Methanomassiliicoccales archaeon]|nr:MAG: porphobilinogen synthase [Methanomassiliicoccales archaeon]